MKVLAEQYFQMPLSFLLLNSQVSGSRLTKGVLNNLYTEATTVMQREKVEPIPTAAKYHLVIVHHLALCHCQYNHLWHLLSFHQQTARSSA